MLVHTALWWSSCAVCLIRFYKLFPEVKAFGVGKIIFLKLTMSNRWLIWLSWLTSSLNIRLYNLYSTEQGEALPWIIQHSVWFHCKTSPLETQIRHGAFTHLSSLPEHNMVDWMKNAAQSLMTLLVNLNAVLPTLKAACLKYFKCLWISLLVPSANLIANAHWNASVVGSTCACEVLFSKFVDIKTKYHNRLKENHANQLLCTASSTMNPCFGKVVESQKQNEVSH